MSLKESKASTIKNSTSCFPQTGSNTGLIKHLYFTRWGSSEGYVNPKYASAILFRPEITSKSVTKLLFSTSP
jgi:hypothetical protein